MDTENKFVFDNELKRKIYREIGYFFFERNGDDRAKTFQSLSFIEIHDIKFENRLVIVCTYPGSLIGKKGECIDALQDYLKKFYEEEKINIPCADIHIEENTAIRGLYAFDVLTNLENI